MELVWSKLSVESGPGEFQMKSAAKGATKAATKRFTKAAAKKSGGRKTAKSTEAARETQVLKTMDPRTRRAVKALFELKGYL